eukprot:2417705-Rhodomonas_salina.1
MEGQNWVWSVVMSYFLFLGTCPKPPRFAPQAVRNAPYCVARGSAVYGAELAYGAMECAVLIQRIA